MRGKSRTPCTLEKKVVFIIKVQIAIIIKCKEMFAFAKEDFMKTVHLKN